MMVWVKKGWFTKTQAIVGLILLWLPLVAPVVFLLLSYIRHSFMRHSFFFKFEYLMPFKIFYSTLAGGALLIWAAIRARSQVKLICWCMGVILGMLVVGNLLAVIMRWDWFVVADFGFIDYYLAVIAAGIGGILLIIHLFKKRKAAK